VNCELLLGAPEIHVHSKSLNPSESMRRVLAADVEFSRDSEVFDFIHARNVSAGVSSGEHLTFEMMR
jgi:hypothetical protein